MNAHANPHFDNALQQRINMLRKRIAELELQILQSHATPETEDVAMLRHVIAVCVQAVKECERLGRNGQLDGTRQSVLLAYYKLVLASILPQDYLTADGLLKLPSGDGRQITFILDTEYSYYGMADDVVKRRLVSARHLIEEADYDEIVANIDAIYGGTPLIAVSNDQSHGGMAGGFPHEVFHDIQAFLMEFYPGKLQSLQNTVTKWKEQIIALHENAAWAKGRYPIGTLFMAEQDYGEVGSYPGYFSREIVTYFRGRRGSDCLKPGQMLALRTVVKDSQFDLGRLESIPQLLSGIGEGDEDARSLLSQIFAEAGFNKAFADKFPRRFD
jgi:hypothetical protein